MEHPQIVVSGTRPTGHMHLGNYLGAVKQYVALQEEGFPSYFFVADYHSLTTHPNPKELKANVKTILIEYLACGLDPDKTVLYAQSALREIPELYLMLNMHAYIGELERVPTFKDKVRAHPENVNAGLFTYPTLMAADILIHRGTHVPVGKDQEQHLELARLYARRFNNIYQIGLFPEPQPKGWDGKLVKVPGLQGGSKMSKSEDPNSVIYLIDDEKTIEKKIKRALTDTGTSAPGEGMSEGVTNLFELMKLVGTSESVGFFKNQHEAGIIRYGDMKAQLYQDMIQFLEPIRNKIKAIENDTKYLETVLEEGAAKARESALKTIAQARIAIGLD